jgi:hypothetical protein
MVLLACPSLFPPAVFPPGLYSLAERHPRHVYPQRSGVHPFMKLRDEVAVRGRKMGAPQIYWSTTNSSPNEKQGIGAQGADTLSKGTR